MACGIETEIVERYWTVCTKKVWGVPIPYPCRKTHEVTKYCYDFSFVHENSKALITRFWGCCDNREYKWTRFSLGWFDVYFPNKRICFSKPLDSVGGCTEGGSIPPGGIIPGGPLEPGDVLPNPDE